MNHPIVGAVAAVRGSSMAPNLSGIVRFFDTPAGVRVDARVRGLPKNATGFYGFHLHEAGECAPPDFSGAKGHYNPSGKGHPLHAGDFPPLLATRAMDAWLAFVTTRFSVREIIGRSVVIHMNRDDFTSQPAGDSGPRIGCGVIRELKEV
jgi:Cu-Zn family superoxide dismutase